MKNKKKYYVSNDEVLKLFKSENLSKKQITEIITKKLSYMVLARIKKHRRAEYYEDLIQEGMIGLIKAVADFDYNRGPNFFKFAEWHIQNRIRNFWKWHNRAPMFLKKNKELKRIKEEILDINALLEKLEGNNVIAKAVNKLPEILRNVISMKFGIFTDEEHTFEEIGDDINLSRQRAEQIKCQAVLKLNKNPEIRKFFIGE